MSIPIYSGTIYYCLTNLLLPVILSFGIVRYFSLTGGISLYDLDDRLLLIELFEIYEPLFTKRQREIFRLYYFDDLSLGEIAEELGIRRQTIHGVLKEIERKLLTFEENLKLAYRKTYLHEIVNHMKEILHRMGHKDSREVKELQRQIERLEEFI